MSISLPSRLIYAVDIPEVKELEAEFNYSFFVPDESVSEISGVPKSILAKPAEHFDTNFVQFINTRVPRYVHLTWDKPVMKLNNDETSMKTNNTSTGQQVKGLISNNLGKIITEDYFASFNYTSVTFSDNDIDAKMFNFVSGTYSLMTLEDNPSGKSSQQQIASRLKKSLPKIINFDFIDAALADPKHAHGLKFKVKSGNGHIKKKNRTKRINEKVSSYFSNLDNVKVHTQINSRLLNEIVDRSVKNPFNQYADSVAKLHSTSKILQRVMKSKQTSAFSEDEFEPVVPYVGINVHDSTGMNSKTTAKIVGYVIDKLEMDENGATIEHPPIVVENANATSTVDLRCVYGKTYVYSIKTITLFSFFSIEQETNDTAQLDVLISSKPSTRVITTCIEDEAPPVPNDINFAWNYETDKLMIHWMFPVNSQRDIKKFQVFRRKTINEPFELIKMYDFDDSVIKAQSAEDVDENLIETLISPKTFYIDDDFTREKKSKYIYSLCSIDAHGMTSNYSAQFEIEFDEFKNKLRKTLISHSGAPKAYPNLYLENDTFVDTISVSGNHSKRMKLYFNPEFYSYATGGGQVEKLFASKQDGGSYKLQIINTDNQRSQIVDIIVDDRTTQNFSQIISPRNRNGR